MPWLFVLLAICLIIVNIKAIKKDDKSFGNVLKYKEKNVTDVNLEIGQLRKDFADTILDLQKQILALQETVEELKDEKSKNEDNKSVKIDEKTEENNEIKTLLSQENGVIDDINKGSKSQKIKELLDMGLSDSEICEKLSLGKGEVLLVKNLYKK